MNEEEKKAIERIDYIQDFIIENGQYNADVNDMEYFSKILNLIEKQQKEIQQLKYSITKATKIIDEYANETEKDTKKLIEYQENLYNNY